MGHDADVVKWILRNIFYDILLSVQTGGSVSNITPCHHEQALSNVYAVVVVHNVCFIKITI